MTKFNKSKYKALSDNFIKVYKRIQPYEKRRTLTENAELLGKYKTDIVNSYNNIIGYLYGCYNEVDEDTKALFSERAQALFDKFKKAINILNLNYDWDEIFKPIDAKLISEKNIVFSVNASSSTTPDTNISITDISDSEGEDTLLELDDEEDINNFNNSQSSQDFTMPQSKAEVLKLCAPTLNYKFSGDPSKLECFLNDIEMLEEVVEEINAEMFFKIVVAKLEGRALEAKTEDVETIAQLKQSLRKSIKHEDSKVIEGKMLALRLDKTSNVKFSEQLENLAEQLRCSYIAEEYSKKKASELSIQHTVETCMKQTKYDSVKSILMSSSFTSPAEVVAKMTVVQNKFKQDKFESNAQNKPNFYQQNRRGKFGRGNFHNNRNNFFRNNDNQQSNENGNRNHAFRGGRGGFNRNNGQPHNNFNRRNQQEHVIRLVQGNGQDPHQGRENQEQNTVTRIPQ